MYLKFDLYAVFFFIGNYFNSYSKHGFYYLMLYNWYNHYFMTFVLQAFSVIFLNTILEI